MLANSERYFSSHASRVIRKHPSMIAISLIEWATCHTAQVIWNISTCARSTTLFSHKHVISCVSWQENSKCRKPESCCFPIASIHWVMLYKWFQVFQRERRVSNKHRVRALPTPRCNWATWRNSGRLHLEIRTIPCQRLAKAEECLHSLEHDLFVAWSPSISCLKKDLGLLLHLPSLVRCWERWRAAYGPLTKRE